MAKFQYKNHTPGHVMITVPAATADAKPTQKDVMMGYNKVYELPADDANVKRLVKFKYLAPYTPPVVATPAEGSKAAELASKSTVAAPASNAAAATTPAKSEEDK